MRTDTSIQYISMLNSGRLITKSLVGSASPLIGKSRELLGSDVILDHKSVFDISHASIMTIGDSIGLHPCMTELSRILSCISTMQAFL